MPDWSTYTDEELDTAYAEIGDERARRWQLMQIPLQMIQLNREYMDTSDVSSGDAWAQPTGAHNAYPKDWVVTHNDKTWVSTTEANVWEPGVSGWQEPTTPENEWPTWVQPTGAHDAYDQGAKVSHNGTHWVSTLNANVWVPGAPGSETLWTAQP